MPTILSPSANESGAILWSGFPAKAGTHGSAASAASGNAPMLMLASGSCKADEWVPAFAGTRGEGFTSSALRQAQDALADDVALDLAGAAGDRVLPGAEDAVVPARSVGHRLGRRIDRRVGTEQG